MKYILPAVSIIILIVIVGVGAFYLGQRALNNNISPAPVPTTSQTNTNNQVTPILTPTPTQSQVQTKTITAGGVLSFPTYTLKTPIDWNSQREQGQDSDKLTLTKNSYKIVISEAAFGGGGCIYPGGTPSEMAQTFSSFVEIINPNGFVFRRGATGSAGSWTVCQKNTVDGSFGAPTIFGHTSITTPANADASVMAEIDGILASLKKQ